MAEHPPLVAALVLNWRLPDATLQVARDLAASGHSALATLLIDNGSADGSAERLAAAEGCELLALDENVGYCTAINRGVDWAVERGAELVLLLNNDVRLPPGFLPPLVDALACDDELACVGPTVVTPDGKTWCQGADVVFGANLVRLRGQGRPPAPTTAGPEEVDFVPGACALFRLADLRAAGGLDETYFMYWEDADLGARLRARGKRVVWLPWVRVEHDASRSSGGGRSPFRKYAMAVNVVRYLRAHGTMAAWCAFWLFEVLLWPLAPLTGTGPRAAWAKARGLVAGLCGRRVTAADVTRFHR